MSAFILSLIRTYVPIAVGSFVAWLLTLGIEVSNEVQAGIITGITGLLIAGYYTLVRFLENRWPALSVLLGSSQIPAKYTTTGDPQ